MYCFWICEGETLRSCFLCNLVPFWSNENIKDLCKLPGFMTSFVGGRCVECQVWHIIAKTAAESRSLQFQTTISSIWLSAHQFSSSATAGTSPASDGAPGLRFSVSDSLAQYLWVSVGLSSSSLLFFFFFSPLSRSSDPHVFPLQQTLADRWEPVVMQRCREREERHFREERGRTERTRTNVSGLDQT